MTSRYGGARTALFWRCAAPFDALFKDVLLRLQRDGLRLAQGPNLRQRVLDGSTASFTDGKRVEISQWRDGVEFAEHWDGLALELIGGQAWGIELLKAGPAAVFMIHETEEAYARQRTKAHDATRWAGLLLDLFEAARPEACLFPLNLAGLPCSSWAQAVTQRRKTAELRIERPAPPEPAPAGHRAIKLASGGVLLTSLPVKAAPDG